MSFSCPNCLKLKKIFKVQEISWKKSAECLIFSRYYPELGKNFPMARHFPENLFFGQTKETFYEILASLFSYLLTYGNLLSIEGRWVVPEFFICFWLVLIELEVPKKHSKFAQVWRKSHSFFLRKKLVSLAKCTPDNKQKNLETRKLNIVN